jgi:zinc protease
LPGHEVHISFPATQSHLIFAQAGISRQDPDYFPLVVGNHVLGANRAVSLLFHEIREKRGLSYSVDSYFEPMAAAGPFVISLQTDHRRTREAREALEETLRNFIANGPDEAALAAARQNLIGGFPLRIDNNSKLAEYLTVIGFYDLPLDYLDTYPRAVAAVTGAQIRAAFGRRINLAKMAKITVGPAASPP